MKTNKYINIAAGVALAMGATACSSDYLDLAPEGVLDYEEVLTNAQGATLAVNGMCHSMYKQYANLYDYFWFNGEPWLSEYYGEVVGQDYISLLWTMVSPSVVNWTEMDLNNTSGAQVAWTYCYYLISQANNLITFTPKVLDAQGKPVVNADGNEVPDIEGEYAFRYAQALCFRAHAYFRLMQIYGPRWEDRIKDDGTACLTVPLRLVYQEPTDNLDCPLSTMEEVMDQIYADLNQAIQLFEDSRMSRAYSWEPDLQICKGLYARAAMLRNDYQTAQQMAHDARQGYEIMSSEDYEKGFAEPTSEWMWVSSGDAQGLYYASFGATYACNGAYPCLWGNIGAGAINNDLINQASPYDYRARLYFAPQNIATSLRGRFWTDACNSTTMDINSPNGQLHSTFVSFAQQQYSRVADRGWYPPYTYQGNPMGEGTTICTAQFGAQFKFWGMDGYSTSFFPFMRASEMLLVEAEAAYQNGNQSLALSLLKELNDHRYAIPYDETPSGLALLDAIKISRRLELWGEGFSWFDFKRWNEPIVRNAWEKSNTQSGNWPRQDVGYNNGVFETDMNRGWRWRIPSTEYNYNHAIDQAEATGN